MATTYTTPHEELQRRAQELITINKKIIDARFLLAIEISEQYDDTDYTSELWKVARLLKDGNTLLADMIESLTNPSLINQIQEQ